jgi:hypothetical protein
MFLTPTVAVLWITSVAFTCAEVATRLPASTETPVPKPVSPLVPARLLPAMITGTLIEPAAGCVADDGVIDVRVGATTVNVSPLLVPPFATTVTVLPPVAAAVVIVKVVLIWVPVAFTVKAPWLTPVPLTFSAVVPVRLLPVMVTLNVVPRRPELGEIVLSVGAATPVPVSGTGEPETGALAVIVAVPFAPPVVVGRNATVIEQVAPAASVVPQVPPTRKNGAVTVTVMPLAAPPLLLSVSV